MTVCDHAPNRNALQGGLCPPIIPLAINRAQSFRNKRNACQDQWYRSFLSTSPPDHRVFCATP